MLLQFNAFDYDPAQGGGICFPLADYKLEITSAEPKVVKDNPGAGYLELVYTVVEGDLRGLTHKHRLNLFNPSEVAKRIAHQELSAICFAIERHYIQESAQLIGGRLIATIGPQSDDSKYSEIKAIKMKDGTAPVRPVQQGAAPQGQVLPPATQQSAAPSNQPPAPVAQAASPWGNAAPASAPPANQPFWGSAPPAGAGANATPPWAK
jgi:hypothetical protein